MAASQTDRQIETYRTRIDILEQALLDSAGAFFNINITKNLIPGVVMQKIGDVEYSVNEFLGLPQDVSYDRFIDCWSDMTTDEHKREYLAFFDRAALEQSFAQGDAHLSHRYWVKSAPGTPMLAEQHITMYRDDATGDLLALSYVIDRTQSNEMETALRVAENASRAKTTFLSNMSHDIRTPMNAIIGFTSLAAAHTDDPHLLEDYLKKIMTSSNHLLSLINDVLDMSRIESGRVSIEEKPNNLPTIMHDLRNILQADVHSKRLKFLIDTVDVVDENVVCDKLRLNQILINCMSNAVKFTQPGGTVGIKIVQHPTPERPGWASFDFIISDTGIGMSKDFIEHIFEPFARERTSTVSGIPGTGLGMAITKNIVDMMGGKIVVESDPDVGTEIKVSLDFKTCGETPHRSIAIEQLSGFRALVADDSMDACVSVCRMLEAIGMNPEWTMSGTEAVYKAKYAYEGGRPYRAFVIDWLMPDMNGVEAVRRIRAEIGNDTPIIILTAYDWTEIETEARAAGVTAFLAKPLFMSDLYETLSSAVGEVVPVTGDAMLNLSPFAAANDSKTALVVEDNDLNREIVAAILKGRGIAVEEAENGAAGVEMVRTSEPGYYDLVLMDIQMPVMNGLDAAQAIRALGRPDTDTLPIIAVSANAFDEDKARSLAAGMNGHISKPFEKEMLDDLFEKYLS